MIYIRKIKDKRELFNDDGTLKEYDLANLDISDIDLSDIDSSVWEGANFYHTNFKNTGIKFNPQKLEYHTVHYGMYVDLCHSLAYCNFENCDLSYLTDEDMDSIVIKGTNFRNTNLQIDFRNNKVFSLAYKWDGFYRRQSNIKRVNLTEGTLLPFYYQDKQIDYFDYADLDISFLENNPFIKISSGKLFEIIITFFRTMYSENDIVNEEEFGEYYQMFLEYLKYDQEGKLKRFYKEMQIYLTTKEKHLQFYLGLLKEMSFDELDLTYLDKKMLSVILFKDCNIHRLKLSVSYKELNKEMSKCLNKTGFMRSTIIGELILPTSIHDYQNARKTRMFSSGITMYTNLYLEFKRVCNMFCQFCRNDGLDNCSFDFYQIMKTLKSIYCHLNNIVVGGGEPTIYLEQLELLSDILKELEDFRRINLYVITNCSLNYHDYNMIHKFQGFDFYFSRHAIEDSDNRKIFGDKDGKIMTMEELKLIKDREKHVICCTCFKGGVDSVSKMLDYVKFVGYIGYSHVLFQNLHQEDDYNMLINIDEKIMLETICKLKEQGFILNLPIVSNSNYVLYILKMGNLSISFKVYRDYEEIVSLWNKATKRTFDLSIDPAGNLHETWKQQNDIISLKRKK